MRDVEMFEVMRATILGRAVAYGLPPGVQMVRSMQPTQQGIPDGPFIFGFRIADKRHGSPRIAQVWNETAGEFDRVQVQQMETTWQLNAKAPLVPAINMAAVVTAADVLNYAADILSSDEFRAALAPFNAGVLRITGLRNAPYLDDRDQFADNPSFDVIITHQVRHVESLPHVSASSANVHRV